MLGDKELELTDLVQRAENTFETNFKKKPQWVASAPGRVNLIGEHTDYNGGYVFPMAIQRSVVLAAAPSDETGESGETIINIYSHNLGETKSLKIINNQIKRSLTWTDYIAGIFAGFMALGAEIPSLDIVVDGNVPLGGGLSSSAALEVSVATLLEAVTGKNLSALDKVLLCQKAEHDFAGVPCGIMDQFASVNGKKDHLLLLDCKSTKAYVVPFENPDISILIIDSNVKHQLANGEYAKRREECEKAAEILGVELLRDVKMADLEAKEPEMDATVFKRARHVIAETERTANAAKAMKRGEWSLVGELMLESHASLRDDYEVSCNELDLLVELVMDCGKSKGVLGTRMTGGGFGGCTVSLVPKKILEEIIQDVSARYFEKTGIQPAIFTTRPAQGAQMIKQ